MKRTIVILFALIITFGVVLAKISEKKPVDQPQKLNAEAHVSVKSDMTSWD